jgi:hypothetical protein
MRDTASFFSGSDGSTFHALETYHLLPANADFSLIPSLFLPHGRSSTIDLKPGADRIAASGQAWLSVALQGFFTDRPAAFCNHLALDGSIGKLREDSRDIGMSTGNVHVKNHGCRDSQEQAAFHIPDTKAFRRKGKKCINIQHWHGRTH